jgi:hypothetical protein
MIDDADYFRVSAVSPFLCIIAHLFKKKAFILADAGPGRRRR